MTPSFDPRYLRTPAYEDLVLDELRRGRVARTATTETDYAWCAVTTVTTRWSPDEGFCQTFRTDAGVGDTLTHQPAHDRHETNVSECAIREAIRRQGGINGFRELLADHIRADLSAAIARGDRVEARAHAARLLGAHATDRASPLDEVVRSVAAGDLDEARDLAARATADMVRVGVEVFGLLLRGLREPLTDADRASLRRTEGWLAALAELHPPRGELSYWRAAALELLGRRDEAMAAYERARGLGKVRDFHFEVRPVDLDPPAGRRALRALQKARRASGSKR